MKKYIIGLSAGLVGAVFNVLFLCFAPDIDITIYISTGISWLVIGLLISASNFKTNSIIKGIITALLVSAPSLVYTFSSSLTGALWTLINTVVFGAALGYIIDRVLGMTHESD